MSSICIAQVGPNGITMDFPRCWVPEKCHAAAGIAADQQRGRSIDPHMGGEVATVDTVDVVCVNESRLSYGPTIR